MHSNYILLNYQVNWSDLQSNFLASLKYPVQPWLFYSGSRPPSWGGSFPGCKGGMVIGDVGGFTPGTHGGSLRAYPQPRQLPALCFSSCWGRWTHGLFSPDCTTLPWLYLLRDFSSRITARGIWLLAHFFLQTLLQLRGGNFPWGGEGDVSWEHKP